MEHRCAVCAHAPNIRISNLDYCDTCFERQFLHKVFRHFKKLPFGSKILLYLDGTPSSIVMAHAISRLRNRSIHKFTVASRTCSVHSGFLRDIGLSCHIDMDPEPIASSCRIPGEINPIPKDVIEMGQSSGFDIVVFQADAQIESMMALRSVCNGAGVLESVESQVSKIGGIRAENAFRGIKPKEIGYYRYLNKIPESCTKLRMSGKESVLLRFISRIESKNSLVVFNILNTVKKVVTDKDGIDTSD
ncbi:hypothetical protein KMI_09g14560 [Encephalitozoon hellem]|nr:hypothetical protein KMI_09g14560 [Encephalitozoon hellem]